jgi:hypothetical protein
MSTGQAVKMNVVTRIAIEGKAKQGQEGASIKIYMKVRDFKVSKTLHAQ